LKNDDLHEILDILIEECSEVIQAASKVKRFGEDDSFPPKEPNNAQKLFGEISDLKAMMTLVELSMDGFIQEVEWQQIRDKLKKLKAWSHIDKDFLDDAIGLYDD